MARLMLSATLGAALTAFAALPSPASADDAQIARGRYLVIARGLLGLPHAGRAAGLARHEALPRRIGRRLRDSGRRRIRRTESDARQGDRDRVVEQRPDRHRDPHRQDAGRARLSPVMPWPALSHLTDEDAQAIAAFLKSVPAVDNKNAGPIRPQGKVDGVRLRHPAGRRLQRAARGEEIAASRVYFGRRSRPTPLLTNWGV